LVNKVAILPTRNATFIVLCGIVAVAAAGCAIPPAPTRTYTPIAEFLDGRRCPIVTSSLINNLAVCLAILQICQATGSVRVYGARIGDPIATGRPLAIILCGRSIAAGGTVAYKAVCLTILQLCQASVTRRGTRSARIRYRIALAGAPIAILQLADSTAISNDFAARSSAFRFCFDIIIRTAYTITITRIVIPSAVIAGGLNLVTARKTRIGVATRCRRTARARVSRRRPAASFKTRPFVAARRSRPTGAHVNNRRHTSLRVRIDRAVRFFRGVGPLISTHHKQQDG
jgi:hypothetical protein